MRQAIPAGLALLIVACGNVTSPGPDVTEPDAPVSDDAAPRCVWTEPDATPFANLNGPDDETSATLTGDGLLVFFTRSLLGGTPPKIHKAVRKTPEGQFTGSELVTELKSAADDYEVEISSTGEEIFFTRVTSRDDNPKIWTAARSSAGPFGTAAPIANLEGYSPTISADGLTLYFIDLNTYIMRSKREGMDQAWGMPIQVGERDSGYTSIDVSTDGLHLLMSRAESDQPRVAMASRNSIEQSFSEPVAIGDGFDRAVQGTIALRGGGAWVAADRQIVINIETEGASTDLYISTCVGD